MEELERMESRQNRKLYTRSICQNEAVSNGL